MIIMEPPLQQHLPGRKISLLKKPPKIDKSKMVGESIARKAVELGVKKVVFDRSGYIFHGRVKAVAEGARGEAGLNFNKMIRLILKVE